MKRVDLDSIILLVIILVAVFGIYYDFKVSEQVDLAPQKVCTCPATVGEYFTFTRNNGEKERALVTGVSNCSNTNTNKICSKETCAVSSNAPSSPWNIPCE
ncbi:hypothetical protein J4423_05020 [Candidatus Pacearchaeota archaeon]|nr:hypothetical protein [Candidatus Pacearchaeota archaeon]